MSENTEVKIENNSILSSGYGLIPQMVARDKTISIGAKGLYSYLSSMAGATKRSCYPSRDLITHELNIGKNTFTKYLNELKKSGYIRVKINRQDGKRYNNIYEILFDIDEIHKEGELQKDKESAKQRTKNEDIEQCIEKEDIEQRTKNSDIDVSIENKPIFQRTKKEDIEQRTKKQDVENEDSNSNSININCCCSSNISIYDKDEPVDKKIEDNKNNPIYPIARYEVIKRFDYFSNIEIGKVVDAFIEKKKPIPYLIEKMNLVLNTRNLDNIVGFLIKAIKEDYKQYGVEKILEQKIQEYEKSSAL